MQRFIVLFRSLFLINIRNYSALFWNFAFPLGLVLLYGAIWGNEQFGAITAMTWLTVGIVVLNIMSAGFIGDSIFLSNMRDQGILQRVHATPLPPRLLIGAYVLVRLVLVLIQAILIVVVAAIVYGIEVSAAGLGLAFVFAIAGATVFIVLGQAVAAVAPSASAATALGQVLYFPLMFVSNLFLPIDTLPQWLSNLSRFNPAFMLVDLMRPAITGVPAFHPTWANLVGLLLYGLLGIMIAARFFRWEPKR